MGVVIKFNDHELTSTQARELQGALLSEKCRLDSMKYNDRDADTRKAAGAKHAILQEVWLALNKQLDTNE